MVPDYSFKFTFKIYMNQLQYNPIETKRTSMQFCKRMGEFTVVLIKCQAFSRVLHTLNLELCTQKISKNSNPNHTSDILFPKGMTKKKKSSTGAGPVNGLLTDSTTTPPTPATFPFMTGPQTSQKTKTPEPSTSALIICRNKHWRCKDSTVVFRSRTHISDRHLKFPWPLATIASRSTRVARLQQL